LTSHEQASESIIEPDLPIIDPHHHLHYLPEHAFAGGPHNDSVFAQAMFPVSRSHARYLLEEFLADLTSGHNVRATVFAESHAFYRPDGPEAMKPLGEVEFATGVAAMAASGTFGDIKVCAAIEGYADLRLGDAVEEVLAAQVQAAGGRYRGVRVTAVYDPDPAVMGPGLTPHLLLDEKLRAGVKVLHKLGLSLGVTVFEPQLPEVIDLARAFPETRIILTHVGMPLGIGSYEGKRGERFPIWRDNIATLAACGNVVVKLGGLGMALGGFGSFRSSPPATSEQIAADWGPYIQACIEAFGVDRCMFESNFPEDAGSGSYATVWNAFKRISAGASEDEKTALFRGTAATIYRLPAEILNS
jgi:L-fuconolactonase